MTLKVQSNYSQPKKELNSILVIAHPGHELRVHNWLETARPEVWVLTDGSGRTQNSRVDSTTRVLAKVGGRPGPVYGQMRDVDLYDAVLGLSHGTFIQIVAQLANALIERQIDFIAGDAEEGYNPAHDVCRLVINSAVKLVECKTGKQIVNYDFTLMGPPNSGPGDLLGNSLWFTLDDEAFARKLDAARNYPELKAEVEAAINGTVHEVFREDEVLSQRVRSMFGVTDANTFRVECLRPVNVNSTSTKPFTGDTPFYEAYGEKQVRAGHYGQVLRYRDHMLPLAAALHAHMESNSGRT
jgi:hypothetical protein